MELFAYATIPLPTGATLGLACPAFFDGTGLQKSNRRREALSIYTLCDFSCCEKARSLGEKITVSASAFSAARVTRLWSTWIYPLRLRPTLAAGQHQPANQQMAPATSEPSDCYAALGRRAKGRRGNACERPTSHDPHEEDPKRLHI